MTQNDVIDEYFGWLFSLVCKNRYSSQFSFRKLLMQLHNTVFRYSIPKDQNRAEDGINLRWRFVCENEFPDHYETIMSYLDGPCSVLEMMIALALRCEENIMDDPNIGNRTSQWFWHMIVNLGLGSMTDDQFDKIFVEETIERFLDRRYEPDGRGGLFTVRDCGTDLRTVEIWYQLCWYLDSIT